MDLGLKDKVAFVTGSGSQKGFGKGVALTLAKEGCHVIVADVNIEGAKQTASEVEKLGRKALAVKVDVSNSEEVNNAVKTAMDKFGRIDILVNTAGISRDFPLVQTNEELWHINVEMNFKGPWYTCKAIVPQMIERKKGKIINFSSGGVTRGFANASLYLGAKAGVSGFTKSLAVELGPMGINVNAISPGMGDTGLWGPGGPPPGLVEAVAKNVPMRKITTPQDIGNMVAFLASDCAIDVTGQTISVDGG
jgi:NAD(P)-dependent dehydrogenase (short-subunit alcohol dehydrogenase family)